jgi:hypothetical protein
MENLMSDKSFVILFVISLIIGLIAGAFGVKQYVDCKNRGGAFIEGAVWYECVEAK